MNPAIQGERHQKRKYLRLEHDGAHCVIEPHELETFAYDGEAGDLVITELWMSRAEFEALPEFTGF